MSTAFAKPRFSGFIRPRFKTNLAAAYLCDEGAGLAYDKSGNGKNATPGTATWASGSWGRAMKVNASGRRFATATATTFDFTKKWTLFLALDIDDSNADQTKYYCTYGDGNGTTNGRWKFGQTQSFGAQRYLGLNHCAGGAYSQSRFDCWPGPGRHTFAVNKLNLGATTVSCDFYVDGVFKGNATNSNQLVTLSEAFNPIGALSGDSNQSSCRIAANYLWIGRTLSAGDIARLHADPFAPFRRDRVGTQIVASGAAPFIGAPYYYRHLAGSAA